MLNRTGAVIYVGNLPDDIRERELDDLFYKARLRGMAAFQHAAKVSACICLRCRRRIPSVPQPTFRLLRGCAAS